MSSGPVSHIPDGLGPRDEGRHIDVGSTGWEESWHFDAISRDGGLGLSLRIGRQPERGVLPVWAGLVRDGHRLVHLVDHEIPLERDAGSIGARGEGIWVDAVCETPFDHWSLGLEAFGVELDSPGEALADARGDRIGVGFDLEWETQSAVMSFEASGSFGYQLMCRVHGEVLIGPEVVELEGWGGRQHLWGNAPWTSWKWAGGVLDDGTTWQLNPDGSARLGRKTSNAIGLSNWPESLSVDDLDLAFHERQRAPVLLPSTGTNSRTKIERTLVSVTTNQGTLGSGWLEEARPL